MKFDDLDRRMRRFETALDQHLPMEPFIVARLDGRGFTKLTKETLDLQRPFDMRIHDVMIAVCRHLMQAGPQIALSYTQSDEISLLFEAGENAFRRNARKLNSVLAGEASGVFSLAIGRPVCFDCRLCLLPAEGDVIDYFRWRAEDAKRNALSAFCYWALRAGGSNPEEANGTLSWLASEAKLRLLRDLGIDFEAQEEWKRLGALLLWQKYTHSGINPVSGQAETTSRRRIARLEPMPRGEDLAGRIAIILRDT